MKHLFLLTALAILMAGCNHDDVDNETSVMIRVENNSFYDLHNVVVVAPHDSWDVGDIPAGERSSYHSFDLAYGYAFIQAEIEGSIYRMIPVDYVGATPLKKGRYTYQIGVAELSGMYGSLTLTLINEK